MTLSQYHQKYQQRSEQDMQERIRAKEYELKQIFNQIKFIPAHSPVRIAVLGCGDRRFVQAHKAIFEKLSGKLAIVTTFDITIEHLAGELDVVQHDCALPLPNPPYDITYSSVLLKFIETEKQWNVIKNSYDALTQGGISINFLNPEDYNTEAEDLPEGYHAVPLDRWKHQLKQEGIAYKEIMVKTGPNLDVDTLALILFRPIT